MPIVSRLNAKRNDDEEFDLAGVLDHYGVRVSGRLSQMTNCPFHEDRTPSLSVNIGKGLWRCHSCGEGGDAMTMIMKQEGCDYRTARGIAASLGFAERTPGRSDGGIRVGAYVRTRSPGVSRGSGSKRRVHNAKPPWLGG